MITQFIFQIKLSISHEYAYVYTNLKSRDAFALGGGRRSVTQLITGCLLSNR